MKMRGGYPILLVLALATALGPGALSEEGKKAPEGGTSTRPPRNLKRMSDGHWTPWDPPQPPAGANVHTVSTGETLWGLADGNLKNPYLWPQIWEQNRYVLDSHWIYPGDPIMLPSPEVVPMTPPAAAAPGITITQPESTEAKLEEKPAPAPFHKPEPPAPQPPPPPVPQPVADIQDVYCSSHIQSDKFSSEPWIVGADEEKLIGIGTGSVIYISAGSDDGVKPGDQLAILRDRGKVRHPATKGVLGERVDGMGTVQVLAVQKKSATAEVIFSCEDVLRGDRVVPARTYQVPTRVKPFSSKIDRWNSESTGKPAGYLVVSKEPQYSLGQGNIVNVDLGDSDGVKPGDVLTIYRPNPWGDDMARQNLGEGVVILTEGHTSLVKITAAVREIVLGDRVEIQ